MTRDEVIKMALEAGAVFSMDGWKIWPEELERLVRAAYNAGADATREECAKFFDSKDETFFWGSQVASRIRARKGGA